MNPFFRDHWAGPGFGSLQERSPFDWSRLHFWSEPSSQVLRHSQVKRLTWQTDWRDMDFFVFFLTNLFDKDFSWSFSSSKWPSSFLSLIRNPQFEEGRVFINKVHMVLRWSVEWFSFLSFPTVSVASCYWEGLTSSQFRFRSFLSFDQFFTINHACNFANYRRLKFWTNLSFESAIKGWLLCDDRLSILSLRRGDRQGGVC